MPTSTDSLRGRLADGGLGPAALLIDALASTTFLSMNRRASRAAATTVPA